MEERSSTENATPTASSSDKVPGEKYKRLELLGRGSFGKAFLCKNTHNDNFCVVKQMETSMMTKKEREDAVREARLLKKMDHPNIIKFQEVFMTKRNRLCIVMDYADGGDLHGWIKTRKGALIPETEIQERFVQICEALHHVHSQKVIHRDLKSQNIFLMKTGRVLLGDFGIARILEATKDFAKSMVGTPYYLSPEIIEEQPYNFKSDVWSLGVILYELATLKHPFDAESLHFLAIKILNGDFPSPDPMYSPDLETMIRQLLQKEPMARPDLRTLLLSPYLRAAREVVVPRFGIPISVVPDAEPVAAPAKRRSAVAALRAEVAAAHPSEVDESICLFASVQPGAALSTIRESREANLTVVVEDAGQTSAANETLPAANETLPAEPATLRVSGPATLRPADADGAGTAMKPQPQVSPIHEDYEEDFEDYDGSDDDSKQDDDEELKVPESCSSLTAKAEYVREYLEQRLGKEKFEAVRAEVEKHGSPGASEDLSENSAVNALLNEEQQRKLLPLFQLVVFLRDMARSSSTPTNRGS
jgi:serine/threonine protein kinase